MIRRLFCICSLALIVLLASPASLISSAAQSAEYTFEPYEVKADDGTFLRGGVFLPKGKGPFATVLEYTPYINNGGQFSGTPFDGGPSIGIYQFLIKAGFAVARVSIRGTGRSGGCLQYGNQRDIKDVVTVVNDLATKEWSNGKIGMTGQSYPGWTADMASTAAPKPLKATLPKDGVIDLYRLLTRRGGPLQALGPAYGTANPANLSVFNDGLPDRIGCADSIPAGAVHTGYLAVDGARTGWYEERGLEEALTNTKVPMLRAQGLSGLLEGHILQLEDLWSRLRPDRTHFIIGQWAHFNNNPMNDDIENWNEIVIAWFDHYLRGGPQIIKPGVVEYEDDTFKWHTADQWPPKHEDEVIHISGTGIVGKGEPVEPADASLQSVDALDPGLNNKIEGMRLFLGDDVAREDHSVYNSTCGPHQALYVSPPLEKDVLIAGQFEADVTVSSTLPGGNFSVFLWKTSGNGVCPDPEAHGIARSVMDLTHWKNEYQPNPFPVATPTTFWLESQPFASQLKKGERLVLAFGGGSLELTEDPLKPVLTIHKGTFELPIVTGKLRFAEGVETDQLPSPPSGDSTLRFLSTMPVMMSTKAASLTR